MVLRYEFHCYGPFPFVGVLMMKTLNPKPSFGASMGMELFYNAETSSSTCWDFWGLGYHFITFGVPAFHPRVA